MFSNYQNPVYDYVQSEEQRTGKMSRFGCADRLAAGSIAAGGTLGILIPPSVILVIYGITTETNIGALVAFVIALVKGMLTWSSPFETLLESVRTTAMIFAVLIGALIFTNFINLAGLPDELGFWIEEQGLGPYAVLAAIIAIYLILGCVLASLSMILLTVSVIAVALADGLAGMRHKVFFASIT